MDFIPFPKIPRLFRDIVITEKIDGTNAAIVIDEYDASGIPVFEVYAQSRKRLITPESDNFGFAQWVENNKRTLVEDLGLGRHFGEWWGHGIQRGYGMPKNERRFSLFNTKKWAEAEFMTPNLDVVPVLYEGAFEEEAIRISMLALRVMGSYAQTGFRNPEGICVYHQASNQVFKVTLEDDEEPKSLKAVA